ncbi:hypothetical protein AAFF_G00026970 [Aldrovandia affinis]|uniref:Uncharacterized protein n=1 Tax=Aldrovandia affinis TaxID=143900 RepID=A0AAD7VXE7_9TELE|nr:hypothetical protein AAFF_G00026970 [Aldrovandia affinis]
MGHATAQDLLANVKLLILSHGQASVKRLSVNKAVETTNIMGTLLLLGALCATMSLYTEVLLRCHSLRSF